MLHGPGGVLCQLVDHVDHDLVAEGLQHARGLGLLLNRGEVRAEGLISQVDQDELTLGKGEG